jgi:AcrR family transcriptional regulator
MHTNGICVNHFHEHLTVSAIHDRQERADATRQSLLVAARSLFGRQGYASTSVEEVVRTAGVTKGALYHHFRDKDELFRAVVEDVKRDVTVVVGRAFVEAAEGPDALETIVVGCQSFIDAFSDPAVQRIAISDARSVLDAATRRDLDARYEVAVVRGALRRAMNVGAIERQPLAPLAHILTGALAEACALIAESVDKESAQADARAVVARLLEGLRTPA